MSQCAVHRLLVVLIFIMLPGCGDRVKVHVQKQAADELRARYFDIAIPIQAAQLKDLSPSSENEVRAQTIIHYDVCSSLDDLKTFYLNEMERLGWYCIATFTSQGVHVEESMIFLFEKPQQRCVIIINPHGPSHYLVESFRSFIFA